MEGESFLKRNICGYVVVLFYLFIFLSLFSSLQCSGGGKKTKNIPPLIYWNSCVIVGYSHTLCPGGIARCNAEPGTSSSWRGGERFTGL